VLAFSAGAVSAGNEAEFNIILAGNAYTSNLTGTVSITSGNTTVTGAGGTTFNTTFNVGDVVRVGNATVSETLAIGAIAGASSLTTVAAPSTSLSANVYQKYFIAGTVLDSNDVTINIDAGQRTFSVSTGLTFQNAATTTVIGQYPMRRTQSSISFDGIRKDVRRSRVVKIDCSTHWTAAQGPWNLGLPDVLKINHVWVGTGSFANSTTGVDRVSWFTLDNGQRDDVYDHAKLVIKPEYASQITTSSRLFIELDHLVANTSSGVGYFSIDSYPIGSTANATNITYAEVPFYRNIDLRNAIDFRAVKANTANSSTDTANTGNTVTSTNPANSSTSYVLANNVSKVADADANFEADITYFLPRRDILVINKNGDLAVRQGTPKVNPILPFNDRDSTVLAEIYVPPYPSLSVREGEQFNRRDIATKINIRTTRGYTMKDIAALEERIKRLEYYTVLNALEQQARDLTIPDTNGLNRFKNGIFADPFNSHNIGNVTDIEYKIAIDKDETIARPYYKTHDVDFKYNANSSTNIEVTGNFLTLPYDDELYITQRFASKFRNATALIWSWNGKLNLYPSYDYFRNETITPNQNITIDLTTPWEQFANSPFGTIFGDWRTTATSRRRTTRTSGRTRTTTTTTTTTQQQIVESLQVDTLTQTFNLGSYVSDISIQPYMRSRIVAFVAYNMKPNTTLHAFFDDTNVDAHVAPGTLNPSPAVGSLEYQVVDQSGNYGDTLVSDSTGFVCGWFRIPDGQFRVGDRTFRLADVSNLITGANGIITSSVATYSASNMSVTTNSATITTLNPEISTNTNTVVRTLTSTTTTTTTTPEPPAQTFYVNVPGTESGLFITSVGVFFQSKDLNLGVSALICEVNQGYPDTSRIVARGHITSSQVNVSNDATLETQIPFDKPVFLTASQQYAFIIVPDGNSPEYKLWFGETGGYDITTGEQIYSNPYAGVAFISANMDTWTPLQMEDIKFNLYRAKFTTLSGTATFVNEDDEYLTIDGFTAANSSLGTVQIGDVVYTVNATSNVAFTGASDPYGIVQYVDYTSGKLYLDSTRPGFSNTTNQRIAAYRVADVTATSNAILANMIAYGNVISVGDLTYSTVAPKFASMEPVGAQLDFNFKGTDSTYNTDSSYVSVINGDDVEYIDKTRVAVSRSNENTQMSDNKSSFFSIDFSSTSDYVSPVVDMSKKASLFIENIINNDSTNEHTRYGNALTKYVSKRVVLADGQEAEDLLVYMTAYRPAGTDVEVYVKFKNPADSEDFDSKVWSKLSYKNNSNLVYSDPLDVTNYIEYELELPTANLVAQGAFSNSTTGVLQYTNNLGEVFYDGFKEYAVKMVLLSNNQAIVPRLNDVRAIALQV
jgi:hypothetical protein